MTHDSGAGESFAEFKNSFFYGSRSDLNFKFLEHMTEQQAGDFLRELLHKLGDMLNDGDPAPIVRHIVRGQAEGYRVQKNFDYADGPFTPLKHPLSETRLGLLTSSGHFAAGDDPKPFGVENMSQAEAEARVLEFLKAEPVLSAVPVDIAPEQLRVRHGGYDVRGVTADPNVAWPLDRLHEMRRDGVFGTLSDTAFSFVGACSQTRLIKKTGPGWVETLKAKGVEAVLLVPV